MSTIVTESETDKLRRILTELIDDEERYVAQLRAIVEVLPARLDERSSTLGRKVDTHDIAQRLKKHLASLLSLHAALQTNLHKAFLQWNINDSSVLIALQMYIPMLKMAKQFLADKNNIVQDIKGTKSVEFKNVLNEFEKEFVTSGVGLAYSLDMVHQRMCRYQLYMERYDRALPDSAPSKPAVRKAMQLCQKVLDDINETVDDGSKMAALLEVQHELFNCFNVFVPGRVLLKKGSVGKISRKTKQSRRLYLFNDVLLVCKFDATTKKVRSIPMAEIFSIDETDTMDMPCEFTLVSQHRSMKLMAESVAERYAWVDALTGAHAAWVRSAKSRGSKNTMARSISIIPQPNGPGSVAPPWIPDERCSSCCACDRAFGPFLRRHHCRICGRIICTHCFGYVPVPHDGYNRDKACQFCHDEMLEYARNGATEAAVLLKENYIHLFKAPVKPAKASAKPSIHELLIQGYIHHRNTGSSFQKYWGRLFGDYRLELYKAPNDTKYRFIIPVLGFVLERLPSQKPSNPLSRESQQSIRFELRHENAQITDGAKTLRHEFYVDNAETSEEWFSNLVKLCNYSTDLPATSRPKPPARSKSAADILLAAEDGSSTQRHRSPMRPSMVPQFSNIHI